MSYMRQIGSAVIPALVLAATCDSRPRAADTVNVPVRILEGCLLVSPAVGGQSPQDFTEVVGGVLLEEGGFVVADALMREVRWFGPDGEHRRTAGRRGRGPREFEWIAGVRRGGRDTVFVFDFSKRFPVRYVDGQYAGEASQGSMVGTAVGGDTWLAGRSIIFESSIPLARREVTERVARYAGANPEVVLRGLVTDAEVWVRPLVPRQPSIAEWVVLGPGGNPAAVVRIPAHIELLDASSVVALVEWRDADDVTHVQRCGIAEGPDFTAIDTTPSGAPVDLRTDRDTTAAAAALRSLIRPQEVAYAAGRRYSFGPFPDLEEAEGTTIHILHAGMFGWVAVATAGGGPICALGVGPRTPLGWREGEVNCAHSPSNRH